MRSGGAIKICPSTRDKILERSHEDVFPIRTPVAAVMRQTAPLRRGKRARSAVFAGCAAMCLQLVKERIVHQTSHS
jgi:hypothetical protein